MRRIQGLGDPRMPLKTGLLSAGETRALGRIKRWQSLSKWPFGAAEIGGVRGRSGETGGVAHSSCDVKIDWRVDVRYRSFTKLLAEAHPIGPRLR